MSGLVKKSALAGLLALAALGPVSGHAVAATKMIMSNDSQDLSFKGKTFVHLQDEIAKDPVLSKELAVEIYHSGALYNQKTQIQGVQLGGAHLISPTPAIYTNTWPKLNALSLPYLLPSPEAILEAMNDPLIAKELLGDMEAKNLKIVTIWMNGPRNIGAPRPLLTPADMKGVKVRVQPADVYVQSMKVLGANPVTMNWGEVPAAMQQGVIDAVEPTPNAWLSSKLFETAKHITDMRYVYDFYIVTSSKQWWDGLKPDVRQKLQEAVDRTTKWNWDEAEKINEDANARMESMGATVHRLSKDQMAAWVDAVKPVWKSMGEPLVGAPVLARLQEIGDRHR